MNEYTEDSIYSPERLQIIRNRPTEFFPSTGKEGLIYQAAEIITNSIDEIALMATGGKLTVLMCIDRDRHTYQIVVIDNGRGLPIGKLRDSFAKPHTSGKFNTKAYEFSGGLFGVGAKASAGTALYFKAITHRPEGSAGFFICQGVEDEELELINTPPDHTGVTVLLEPDPTMFQEIDLFSEWGATQLHTLVRKYCFFRKLNVEFHVHPLGLPADIWKKSIPETEAILHQYIAASHLVFTEETFDRMQWLRSYWNVQRPFVVQHTIGDTYPAQDKTGAPINVRYELRLYYVKFQETGGRFGMINNVPIDDVSSTHFITVLDVLKPALAGYIKDAAIREYFLDKYRLPVFLAIELKYPGAEFAGTTKDKFISRPFRSTYEPSLKAKFATPESVAFLTTLYGEIAEDIESKYTIAMTGAAKVKNMDRLFMNLNYPGKYKDCSTTDRLSAELFLVEGDSAGGGAEGRNNVTQALYYLRGKPFNGITSQEEAVQSAIDIRKNKIYADIITVMGINPAKFDRNTLNFGKLIIMTDADDHGQHISSIVTSNLSVLCPELVEAGILHVVTPPLYGLDLRNRKQKLPRVYLRNDDQMEIWKANFVYMKTFDIGVRLKGHLDKTYQIQGKNCIDFLRLVMAIGEAVTNVANELVLPPLVVERLTHATAHLDLERGPLNVERIKEVLGFDRVTYDHHGHILILTLGRDDYIVPLQNVRERLLQTVTPLLNLIRWRTTQIYITSKNKPAIFQDQAVSVMELFTLLKTLDDQFEITRYKGLGSMPPADKYRTCMDPERRSMHSITSIGDVQTIFNLLGNDSVHRKKLLKKE